MDHKKSKLVFTDQQKLNEEKERIRNQYEHIQPQQFEQEYQNNMQKAKDQLEKQKRNVQNHIINSVINITSIFQEEQQKELMQNQQKHDKDQKVNVQANFFTKINKQIEPIKKELIQLQNLAETHKKLTQQKRMEYSNICKKLIEIFGKINPANCINVKDNDVWMNQKIAETQKIVGDVTTKLSNLLKAGFCGLKKHKLVTDESFVPLKHITDYFWQTLIKMKINAKEGIEYVVVDIAKYLNQNTLRDIVTDSLNELSIKPVEKTIQKSKIFELHLKTQVVADAPPPQYINVPAKDKIKEAYEWVFGLNKPQHIPKGLEILYQQAEQKDLSAINTLGKIHYEGKILPKNIQQAYSFYSQSKDAGDPEGQYKIGQMYESGDICAVEGLYQQKEDLKTRYTEAIKLYEKAAQQGHLGAITDLGYIYDHGLPVIDQFSKVSGTDQQKQIILEDNEKAEKYFKNAVDQNYPRALNNLGRFYKEQGNKKEAFRMFDRATKLLGGNARASFNLGVCYQKGLGVQQNMEMAKSCFKESYERGDLLGKQAYAYFILQEASLKDDDSLYQKALNMFRDCLNEDPNLAESYYYLGYMYEYGFGITQSEQTALNYYQEAYNRNLPKAINKFGEIYEYGYFGIQQDDLEAKKYYIDASNLGDDNAMVNLGRLYEIEERFEEAFKLYKKSAKLGNGKAQTALGQLYRDGKGVEQDEQLAFEYINLGAQKDANAKYLLEKIQENQILEQQEFNSQYQTTYVPSDNYFGSTAPINTMSRYQ